ncbi:MAG: soxX, partial [Betaproteobacteria bacterium]|nr:soxX [Betaproteobacteria bacterium]
MTQVSGAACILLLAACAMAAEGTVPYVVQGDAIPEPLTTVPGEPARGREVVTGRDANCLLCHAIPETGERFMGNVAPSLSAVGTRLTPGQLRLRVVDPTRLKPDVAMPAYYRTQGLDRVMEPYRGKPVLSAQQVEDVVAYLTT